MMKKTKESSGAGESYVSSGSIIAMGKRSVNGFPSFESTPNLGIGALERGHRVVWMCRNRADQCSAGLGAGKARTSGLSALTRVVSGCQAKKWKKATRTGCDDVFCSLTAMGFTLVEKRKQTSGVGYRCHQPGQPLDHLGNQCGGAKLCHSGGVEGVASRAAGLLAAALGRTARLLARGGALRLAGGGAFRMRAVWAVGVGCGPGPWVGLPFSAPTSGGGTPWWG